MTSSGQFAFTIVVEVDNNVAVYQMGMKRTYNP
jgi:hypothetical protein